VASSVLIYCVADVYVKIDTPRGHVFRHTEYHEYAVQLTNHCGCLVGTLWSATVGRRIYLWRSFSNWNNKGMEFNLRTVAGITLIIVSVLLIGWGIYTLVKSRGGNNNNNGSGGNPPLNAVTNVTISQQSMIGQSSYIPVAVSWIDSSPNLKNRSITYYLQWTAGGSTQSQLVSNVTNVTIEYQTSSSYPLPQTTQLKIWSRDMASGVTSKPVVTNMTIQPDN
jgi:hypothetical protein